MWGVHDRLVDVSLAPRAADTVPDSRLLVLDDCGHVAQMERPDLVARAVLAMLDEAAAGQGRRASQRPGARPAPAGAGGR